MTPVEIWAASDFVTWSAKNCKFRLTNISNLSKHYMTRALFVPDSDFWRRLKCDIVIIGHTRHSGHMEGGFITMVIRNAITFTEYSPREILKLGTSGQKTTKKFSWKPLYYSNMCLKIKCLCCTFSWRQLLATKTNKTNATNEISSSKSYFNLPFMLAATIGTVR